MSIQKDIIACFFNLDVYLDRSLKGKLATQFKIIEKNVIIDWLDPRSLSIYFDLNSSRVNECLRLWENISIGSHDCEGSVKGRSISPFRKLNQPKVFRLR